MDGSLVNQMRQKYPENFIGLAGISAGSGQGAKYLLVFPLVPSKWEKNILVLLI